MSAVAPPVQLQFQRLLLGTVVDVLRAERVQVDLSGLRYHFAPETGFRFRWVDNWMRFRGQVAAPLAAPLDESRRQQLQQRFLAVWPELLTAVGTLPLADPLTLSRNEITVAVGAELVVAFDFEAD